MRSNSQVGILCLAFAGLAACTDQNELPLTPNRPELVAADVGLQEVPPRTVDPRYNFVHMSDDSLWQRVVESGNVAVIGLKAPGANRGVYKGRVLIRHSEVVQAKETILALRGVEILNEHERLPVMRIKVPDIETFVRVRRLPFTDYIEPTTSKTFAFADPGCSNDPFTGQTMYSASGDVTPLIYKRMYVDLAWNRSNGSGITIGLTDTGIYQSSDQMYLNFTGGLNRTAEYYHTLATGGPLLDDSGCSHGTRMGGIMAAPRDGRGPVGVAWGANFVSARFNDDVVTWDSFNAAAAIAKAASRSHIITMAWGTATDWFNCCVKLLL